MQRSYRRRASLYAIVIFLAAFQSAAAALTVTQELTLKFGTIFASNDSGGTVFVQVDALGGTQRTCSSFLRCYDDTDWQVAKFRIEGTPGATYDVLLPDSTSLTGLNDSNLTMNVTDFHKYDENTIIDSTTGKSYFKVGAKLHVTRGQREDDYAGTYNVTVDYN